MMKRSERAAPEPSVGVQLAPDQMIRVAIQRSFQQFPEEPLEKNEKQPAEYVLHTSVHTSCQEKTCCSFGSSCETTFGGNLLPFW